MHPPKQQKTDNRQQDEVVGIASSVVPPILNMALSHTFPHVIEQSMRGLATFHSVCPITEDIRGYLLYFQSPVRDNPLCNLFPIWIGYLTEGLQVFSSQLWGELRRTLVQEGLQSVTLSP